MSTKHTPGPWGRDRYGDVVDGRGQTIRVFGLSLTSSDEAKANSCLIAAAPDLLEAAQAFVAWSDASGLHASPDSPIGRARAAIAKATGADA